MAAKEMTSDDTSDVCALYLCPCALQTVVFPSFHFSQHTELYLSLPFSRGRCRALHPLPFAEKKDNTVIHNGLEMKTNLIIDSLWTTRCRCFLFFIRNLFLLLLCAKNEVNGV